MVGYVVVAGQCVITHQQFPFSHSHSFLFLLCFTVTLNTFFPFSFSRSLLLFSSLCLIMARQESLEDEPWLIVEPDPGIKDQQEKRSRLTESFTGSLSQLCSNMGVQGVQVEQICSLNRGMLHDLRYDLVNFNRDDPGHREQPS